VRVGVPRETMEAEHRVALAPSGAREIVGMGHEVLVELGAGDESGLPDALYERAGATLVDAAGAWSADLVCKVKEPLPEEFRYLRDSLTIFTFLHLAAHTDLTRALAESGCVAIAYETVSLPDGRLPLLAPMSEIAGRMAPHVGAHYLEAEHGVGMLLGGVPGVRPARVVVLGAGVAGRNAATIASGMEAEVLLFDKDLDKLRNIDAIHQGRIVTIYSSRDAVEQAVLDADVVVGAVLVPGARAPVVVTEDMVEQMQPGRVIIDISVDQGGCIETSRPTTHRDPVFAEHGVLHYCVGNIPGAVPHTSTHALTHVTLPYVESIVELGLMGALHESPALVGGVNVFHGHITNEGVADAHGLRFSALNQLLAN
jgi:alanine dehydrogenase